MTTSPRITVAKDRPHLLGTVTTDDGINLAVTRTGPAAPITAVFCHGLGLHAGVWVPRMLSALQSGDSDIVIASRYVAGGSSAGLADQNRARLSHWGGLLATKLLRIPGSDAMSGCFMMRRYTFPSDRAARTSYRSA